MTVTRRRRASSASAISRCRSFSCARSCGPGRGGEEVEGGVSACVHACMCICVCSPHLAHQLHSKFCPSGAQHSPTPCQGSPLPLETTSTVGLCYAVLRCPELRCPAHLVIEPGVGVDLKKVRLVVDDRGALGAVAVILNLHRAKGRGRQGRCCGRTRFLHPCFSHSSSVQQVVQDPHAAAEMASGRQGRLPTASRQGTHQPVLQLQGSSFRLRQRLGRRGARCCPWARS